MNHSEYVAAIDVGTSKSIAMAARKDAIGMLSILATEKMEWENCVLRGRIYNVDETRDKVNILLTDLDNQLKKTVAPVEKIYVGIGGQSLRTIPYQTSLSFEGTITREILASLRENCIQHYDFEFLDVASVEYYVDGELREKPLNTSCHRKIEGRFQLILGRPALKANLQKSIEEKSRFKIAGYFISPLATAVAVLTDKDKEAGCALVEMGAGVTYLSIYKNRSLKYLITIPLGSETITSDIVQGQKVSKEVAEELKISYGNALLDTVSNDTINLSQQTIELQKLNGIVEARTDEIIANIVKQIEQSGYAAALDAGIVITGGGASLKNLRESLQKKSNKEVRLIAVKKGLIASTDETVDRLPANSAVIGLLSMGEENCAKKEEPPKEEIKKEEVPKEAPKNTDDYWNTPASSNKPAGENPLREETQKGTEVQEKESSKKSENEKPPINEDHNKKLKPKKRGFIDRWAGKLFEDE